MKQPLLVLDVHYLAHRAFHSSSHLEWKGVGTGVVFGLLKSISQFKDEFNTDRIAFCFEGRGSARKLLYSGYKEKRRTERSPEEVERYNELTTQIGRLRTSYLPEIGFKNIFCFPELESDDIMAVLALHAGNDEEVILITADSDLFQCLRTDAVTIYSPQRMKLFTEQWFVKEYGIQPRQWAVVKAIAGCTSDCVKGVPGVGEKTALKFVKGELPEKSKAYSSILSDTGKEIVRRNRLLVKLPFATCPIPEVREDKVTKAGWESVCKKLGMKSIATRPPIASRRRLM